MTEEVKIEDEVVEEKPQEEDANGNERDFVDEVYSQHGGDPRKIDISFCVLLSHLPTDFLADTYEQFLECIKNLLAEDYKIDSNTLKQVVRIPKIEEAAPSENNALRALLVFSEKTHKHRMMGRKKDVESAGMKIESLEQLPEEFLSISEEDANALETTDYEIADEVGEDDDDEREDEHNNGDGTHDLEYEYEDDEHETESADGRGDGDKKRDDKDAKGDSKDSKGESKEALKKKVYEDEDDKAAFEVNWEGAPEFQWRLCDGTRDEKRLIIENVFWADLQNPFIYRCLHRATNVEVHFPMRYSSDATRQTNGRLVVIFPGWVAIMEEALKHLIYFRSGDGRRIKIFLPQTPTSLKKKEEFEAKLGRLIKPTPRMMELVVKILPADFEATLDDACAWFPYQAVIACNTEKDEMGQPCAVVKFETAEEAVAAHACKSFVQIETTVKKTDSEGNEKEEKKTTNCNIFMRGVEAHFGSLLTFYDQKKKAYVEREAKRKETSTLKRPAASTIRAPHSTKRGRNSSPRRGPPRMSRGAPRGGRGGPRGRSPPPRRSGPTSRPPPPARSTRGGRGRDAPRSAPRPSYRSDSYSAASRAPQRSSLDRRHELPFGQYGYPSENRFTDRQPTVDPFGRPLYGGNTSYTAPFASGREPDRYSSYDSRRRY